METIKINNLMEDKELKDTRFFLMEFGREVMKNIGEEIDREIWSWKFRRQGITAPNHRKWQRGQIFRFLSFVSRLPCHQYGKDVQGNRVWYFRRED